MRRLASEFNVSMVAPDTLLERHLTLEIKDQTPEQTVALIGRLLSCEVTQEGSVWILGASLPTDRVVIVRRVRGLQQSQIQAVIAAVGGQQQSLVVLDSGIVVMGGTPSLIARIDDVLRKVEETERPLWAVQLHLVTLSGRDLTDLGFSVSPALDLAVNQAIGSSVPNLDPVRLEGSLRAVLRASQIRSSVHVVGQPVFLVLDGGEASFTRQKQFPYRTRVATQTGSVQDSGVSYLAAGTTVSMQVREVSARKLFVNLKLEVSELGELVAEGLPTRDSRNHEAFCALEDGGCYLLTSFETTANRETSGSWFNFGRTFDNSQEVLQVWARAVAVNPPGDNENAKQDSVGNAPADLPGDALPAPAPG